MDDRQHRLLWALFNMVGHRCERSDGRFDSHGEPALAQALRALGEFGVLEIEEVRGPQCRGTPIAPAPFAPPAIPAQDGIEDTAPEPLSEGEERLLRGLAQIVHRTCIREPGGRVYSASEKVSVQAFYCLQEYGLMKVDAGVGRNCSGTWTSAASRYISTT
jgi:hypothetical protein